MPIIVFGRGGATLYNYSVRVVLNSSNFGSWSYVSENGSDIYFTDENGNPLYYWIEYFNKSEQRAVIWIRIPQIPALDKTVVYMHYGDSNPYASYMNGSMVFMFFDDFSGGLDPSRWSAWGDVDSVTVEGGVLKLITDTEAGVETVTNFVHENIEIVIRWRVDNAQVDLIFRYNSSMGDRYQFTYEKYNGDDIFFGKEVGGTFTIEHTFPGTSWSHGRWYTTRIAVRNDTFVLRDDEHGELQWSDNDLPPDTVHRGISIATWWGTSLQRTLEVDYVFVRKLVDPEPAVYIGNVTGVTLGGTVARIKPFLYDPNIVHFIDDFNDSSLSQWVQAESGGSYSVSNSILSIMANSGGHITFYTTDDVVNDYVAVYARLRVTSQTGTLTAVGLCDTIPTDYSIHIDLRYNSNTGAFDIVVVKGATTELSLLQSLSVDPNQWIEVLIIYVEGSFEGFVKREGVDAEWQPLFQYFDTDLVPYMKKVWIGSHVGASGDWDKVVIYESAGTGLKDPRPVFDWSDGVYDPHSFLRSPDGKILWFATESYYGGGTGRRDRIVILKSTEDLSQWEIVKHITVVAPGYAGQGILFKWSDGKIHGFIMNWRPDSPPYQGGLHRILQVEMDADFNVLSVNENVTLFNAPPGGSVGHYDIWITYISGRWYAVTSSFTGGTQVWVISDPLDTTFEHYKEVFPASNRENIAVFPAVDRDGDTWLLMTLWDRGGDEISMYKLTTDFDVVEKVLSVRPGASQWNGGVFFILPGSGYIGRFIVCDHDLSPLDLLQHDAGYYIHVYSMITEFTYFYEAGMLVLPPETLYLVHVVVYSPNSTQFTHDFTATNTSAAGFETGYGDAYGWRVYADPYQSGGVGYENLAVLVSEVNVTLPYSEIMVENVTLLVRANGTGSLRQLSIVLLNSTGGIIAELSNASFGTGWSEVTIPVNMSVSGWVTIRINATVRSTADTGEELAVRDVRLYAVYSTNPVMTMTWFPNVDFNCSAKHYVELGSAEYLNSSTVLLKLVEYLSLVSVDYPVEATYVGNETVEGRVYKVYSVGPANYSQYMTVYASMENRFKEFRVHVKGVDTELVLVGEPLTIDLPEPGNVTVVELGRTFVNVTSVTLTFSSVGAYTVEVNLTRPLLWRYGYGKKLIHVKYGEFAVKPIDVDYRAVDYEELVVEVLNRTSGAVVKEITGNEILNITGLFAYNYSVVVEFRGVVVGARDFELNITTDGLIVEIPCSMKSLAADYRGLNKSVAWERDKQLISVSSLSNKFPFSRMRVLLNGTGPFRLYINYRGDLPTKVSVEGNVTGLKYRWDGNYLVIEGALGSVGELNITDLYRLRVEIYDRLGNLMPSWIYAFINGTKYSGAVVEDYLYPEDYVVELPKSINGFEFYSFFDGYNGTARAIAINESDVTLKVWYRVPTSVKEVKGCQVASPWWAPLVKQGGSTAEVYVEGYLVDYYGHGVPNRPVVVNITDVEAGFTWSINATTDATGYFRTPLLELVRGRTYRIVVSYGGDDVYVGSSYTSELKPEELPAIPAAPFVVEWHYIVAAFAAALILFGIVAALRAAKHVVWEVRSGRRFVMRKQQR